MSPVHNQETNGVLLNILNQSKQLFHVFHKKYRKHKFISMSLLLFTFLLRIIPIQAETFVN